MTKPTVSKHWRKQRSAVFIKAFDTRCRRHNNNNNNSNTHYS